MFQLAETLEDDRLQTALTRRFLLPAIAGLEALFLELRAEADQAVPAALETRYDKPYPYGCCMEITADVLRRLEARLSAADSPGDRALKAFVGHGGRISSVWGVLRDRYFQNAIQVGGLYVDVANDTVDPLKPKVEILPMRESGLVMVRDGAHFARIGEAYWGVRLYANTAATLLAPYFPLISVGLNGDCRLATRNLYMVRLFARNGFRPAEQWLRDGPPPPASVVARLREACPPDLLGDEGLDAALEACRRLRRERRRLDEPRLAEALTAFDRIPIVNAPPLGRGVADPARVNARPGRSVSRASIQENQSLSFTKHERNRNIFLSMGK